MFALLRTGSLVQGAALSCVNKNGHQKNTIIPQLDVFVWSYFWGACFNCMLLLLLLRGFNCSVFAYGSTGAGKTFTMIGTEREPGVMSRTVDRLFAEFGSDQSVSVVCCWPAGSYDYRCIPLYPHMRVLLYRSGRSYGNVMNRHSTSIWAAHRGWI